MGYFLRFDTLILPQIDVYKRQIQEYGKIKALGATKKQMKQLIFREGIFLTIFSIPVGLLLGFLIAKCGFNWLVEQGNLVSTQTGSMGVQNQQMPLFSLPVMLLCIFVSFFTVALALRKPMKIVSRISPIEATRYLENAETHKKGKRNGRKNVTVFSMAMANITGNPKRTIGTILTLGLSCALFVIISNYVGNIDTEHEARLSVNHGQFELQLDYSAEYDERYPENNLDTIPVSYTHLLTRADGEWIEIQNDKLYHVVTDLYTGQMLGSVT